VSAKVDDLERGGDVDQQPDVQKHDFFVKKQLFWGISVVRKRVRDGGGFCSDVFDG